MFPKDGPVKNESYRAEPTVYHALASQLSDEFIVIHSLPWLAQIAREYDGRFVPTGEIDFLILHPTLGILALEIKGGNVRVEGNMVVFGNGSRKNPLQQVGRGIHALARWIASSGGPFYKFGYAVVLPESSVKGRSLPPAFLDTTYDTPQSLCLDKSDLMDFGSHVRELMHYWQKALDNQPLTQRQIDSLVELLLPTSDFTLTWTERILFTEKNHLQLTRQQVMRLQEIDQRDSYVLSGRNGTGKTLLAMERAYQLMKRGEKVLFLVYNVALLEHVQTEFNTFYQSHQAFPPLTVMNFHELCRMAARSLGRYTEWNDQNWFNEQAHKTLDEAVNKHTL